MATVRLDVITETALKLLSARRGQTQSEVIRDAIARLADAESEPLSAYQRLLPFIGIADSGGKQLSENTGKRMRETLGTPTARATARTAPLQEPGPLSLAPQERAGVEWAELDGPRDPHVG